MFLHLCYDKKGTYKDVLNVKNVMMNDRNNIVIKIRMSTLPLDVLYDDNLQIVLTYEEYLTRHHKKKRIQKKWNKRYGMNFSLVTDCLVLGKELDFHNDTVTFNCISKVLIDKEK